MRRRRKKEEEEEEAYHGAERRNLARLGGVGVRACGVKSKEMRVSVREMSLCLCVCEMRDIFVKAWPTVIIQKRVAARFHLWTSEVHK